MLTKGSLNSTTTKQSSPQIRKRAITQFDTPEKVTANLYTPCALSTRIEKEEDLPFGLEVV